MLTFTSNLIASGKTDPAFLISAISFGLLRKLSMWTEQPDKDHNRVISVVLRQTSQPQDFIQEVIL